MDVAGNTAGEGVAFADQFVKGFVFVGVNTANYAGERLGAVTQHVHIRVDHGLGERCRTAMYEGSAVRFFGAEFFHDVGPDLTGCTQFCDFHEEVCTLVEFESDRLGNIMDIHAPFHHLAYIFHRYRIGVGNFLNAFRSAQGEHGAANENGTQAWRVFLCPFNGSSHLVIQRIQRLAGLAVFNQLADGVGAHNAFQLFHFLAAGFQRSYHHSQQAGGSFPGI